MELLSVPGLPSCHIPAVVQGFMFPGQGHRGNKRELETGLTKMVNQNPASIARRLERDPDGMSTISSAALQVPKNTAANRRNAAALHAARRGRGESTLPPGILFPGQDKVRT